MLVPVATAMGCLWPVNACMFIQRGVCVVNLIQLCSLSDIDECTEGTDQCAQNCHNTAGSYNCSCNIGYRLNKDGLGCDDINECAEKTDQCDQNCHNNVGSYTCSCRTGYRRHLKLGLRLRFWLWLAPNDFKCHGELFII